MAIKEVRLPQVPRGLDLESASRAQEAHMAKVQEVTDDFVKEVEVCCDRAYAPSTSSTLLCANVPVRDLL